jgi:hypothetical protein
MKVSHIARPCLKGNLKALRNTGFTSQMAELSASIKKQTIVVTPQVEPDICQFTYLHERNME